ncbi:hypothetical protein XIS1_1110027 [Xenorhabdus innexi]|uniref:Uncharacterized protein n=1 Tax=Xenorhabdus innexi TaxID=290109 RepID=A0A1N6MQZ7_9GAMM|nr:hypothetical protein XIS1_1110027 [Xenorhabdus innexi]
MFYLIIYSYIFNLIIYHNPFWLCFVGCFCINSNWGWELTKISNN